MASRRSRFCLRASTRPFRRRVIWRWAGRSSTLPIVAAPKQRNTDGENCDIREGRITPEWANKPAKLIDGNRSFITVVDGA
jgi:hypothetical protein